jgi:hypothetical protein
MTAINSNSKVTMSLNEIRAFNPCELGWKTLLKALNKTAPDDEQIPLEFILKSNGIRDAIWCFRVNWLEHKDLYMVFVNECAARAKGYAKTANAAANAIYNAIATYAAYAADIDATNAAIENEKTLQTNHLLQLLTS